MEAAEAPSLSTPDARIDSVCLFSWGANSYGQLCQGHRDDQTSPRQATIAASVGLLHTITGGGGHTLITADGEKLWVCGSNSHGQLGLGSREDTEVLTLVTFPFPVKISHLSGGWDFTLACSEEGDLFSWGSNAFHQLGRDTSGKFSVLPGKVHLPEGSSVVYVAAGLRHALALTSEGLVYGWGQNKKGQVGEVKGEDGQTLKIVPYPAAVTVAPRGKVVQLAAGAYHSAALTDCNEVHLWGCNKYGQLSADPNSSSQQLQARSLSTSTFGGQGLRQVEAGWTHNVVLTESGQVYTWGRADYGQLGRSCDRLCDHEPKPVPGVQGVCRIACGSEHNLALTGEGRLLCWGWNEHGMCGTGDETNVLEPTLVDLPARNIMSIGCGAGHSFAYVSR